MPNISITVKVSDEGDGFRKIAMSAADLKQVVGAVHSETQRAGRGFAQFGRNAIGLQHANDALSGLLSSLSSLSAAYQVQQEAEQKLTTVMTERMGASAADIQSVKDLASAQQQLGIIGDEVQLAGAQQVATFLTQKSSIDVLLPAMNDLLAQQKGFSATGADAVAIANLMGKAMQGQASALRRVASAVMTRRGLHTKSPEPQAAVCGSGLEISSCAR